MTLRRLFIAALVWAVAPVSAAGASLAPVWQPRTTISEPGADTVWPQVVAAPNGAVAVFWTQSDGSHSRVAANIRNAEGVWSGPEWVSPAGEDNVSTAGLLTGVAEDNSFAIGWMNSSYVMYLAVRDSDDSDWTVRTAASLADPGEWFDGGRFASGPAPRWTQITTGGIGGDRRVRVRQRVAGSDSPGMIAEFDEPDSYNQSEPRIVYNRGGDALAAWESSPPSADREIRVARYDKSADTWSSPETVFASPGLDEFKIALADNGDAAVLATTSSSHEVHGTTFDATTGDWTVSPNLIVAGPDVALADVVADGDGQLIAAWQEYDNSDLSIPARTFARTFRSGDGWSAGEDVSAALVGGGAPSMAANADGDVALGMVTSTDPSTVMLGVATRASGASEFGPVEIGAEGGMTAGATPGLPRIALDGLGNVAFAYPEIADSATRVGFYAGDGTGPQLSAVTVPASAVAGDTVQVSVSPFDLWSGVASTTWSFGDGTSPETGSSASHKFASGGSYSVTVTSTDIAGHSSTATRTIVVSDVAAPPADDPAPPAINPPVVSPPIVEARLAGRTVTLNAKVTLKRGKKCAGKVGASTAFGGRSYKLKPTLVNVNGTCRAQGTIKLRKTPSLRTKLRVTLSGKSIKTRTLTTRR